MTKDHIECIRVHRLTNWHRRSYHIKVLAQPIAFAVAHAPTHTMYVQSFLLAALPNTCEGTAGTGLEAEMEACVIRMTAEFPAPVGLCICVGNKYLLYLLFCPAMNPPTSAFPKVLPGARYVGKSPGDAAFPHAYAFSVERIR